MFIYYLVHANYLHAHHLVSLFPLGTYTMMFFSFFSWTSGQQLWDRLWSMSIRPGSHSPCRDTSMPQLLFGTDLQPRGLWESWTLCSYTVIPPSTEEPSVQHLEVSRAFPRLRNPCYHPVHQPLASASIWTQHSPNNRARILQSHSLSTCNASPEASCNQRLLKGRLNTSRS